MFDRLSPQIPEARLPVTYPDGSSPSHVLAGQRPDRMDEQQDELEDGVHLSLPERVLWILNLGTEIKTVLVEKGVDSALLLVSDRARVAFLERLFEEELLAGRLTREERERLSTEVRSGMFDWLKIDLIINLLVGGATTIVLPAAIFHEVQNKAMAAGLVALVNVSPVSPSGAFRFFWSVGRSAYETLRLVHRGEYRKSDGMVFLAASLLALIKTSYWALPLLSIPRARSSGLPKAVSTHYLAELLESRFGKVMRAQQIINYLARENTGVGDFIGQLAQKPDIWDDILPSQGDDLPARYGAPDGGSG